MSGRDPAAGGSGGSTGSRSRGPSARRQRGEMALGIFGFFSLAAFVVAVAAEIRGEPALVEVIVLVFFLSLTYYAYRAWQRS